MKIEIYTRGDCQYCRAAKRLLDNRALHYKEVELTDELAGDLSRRTGHTTTPVVFIDGVLIGGFDELVELDQDGKLVPVPD
jgi:glutaredoxin 3